MKLVVYRDGGDARNTSSIVKEDIKKIISDVLLGLNSNAIIVKEKELLNYVSKGLFHAVGVALKVYRMYRKPVIVSLLKDSLTGIVVVAGYPAVKSGLIVCRIDLGMVVDCNSTDAFM
ncbi:MAG: hypothetical protein GSR84_02450, partial [Desulfurococcales archaeon]|nr:hypothetical protein [Desulfurococcales archaeon]